MHVDITRSLPLGFHAKSGPFVWHERCFAKARIRLFYRLSKARFLFLLVTSLAFARGERSSRLRRSRSRLVASLAVLQLNNIINTRH